MNCLLRLLDLKVYQLITMLNINLRRPAVNWVLCFCILSIVLQVWVQQACVAGHGSSIELEFFHSPADWPDAYLHCVTRGKILAVLTDNTFKQILQDYSELQRIVEKLSKKDLGTIFNFWVGIIHNGQSAVSPFNVDTSNKHSSWTASCPNVSVGMLSEWNLTDGHHLLDTPYACAYANYSKNLMRGWKQCTDTRNFFCGRSVEKPCNDSRICYFVTINTDPVPSNQISKFTVNCSSSAAPPTEMTALPTSPTTDVYAAYKTQTTNQTRQERTNSTQTTSTTKRQLQFKAGLMTSATDPSTELTSSETTAATQVTSSTPTSRISHSYRSTLLILTSSGTTAATQVTSSTSIPRTAQEMETTSPFETGTPTEETSSVITESQPTSQFSTSFTATEMETTSPFETGTPTEKTSSVITESQLTSQFSTSFTATVTQASVTSCRCVQIRALNESYASQDFAEKIKKELLVNKNNLSSTRRKKESAPDPRPSSKGIATVAIVCLVVVFGLILGVDCIRSKA